jgi:N-hydroxyarylamine O-acetyltransferase
LGAGQDPSGADWLPAYFTRIGIDRMRVDGPGQLAELVRAHRLAIPFENLAIRQGRGIDLSPQAVFGKLVTGGRGGYCFEQNLLLSRVLTALGVANRTLLARVLMHDPGGPTPPRTHLLLAATLHGETWLADVGFGAGYCPPLRLAEQGPTEALDGTLHRLRRHGAPGSERGEWVLERSADHGTTWHAQYAFDTAEVALADIEAANHWTSTRPDTRFTTLHICARVTPTGLISLIDRDFTELAMGQTTRHRTETPDEWHELLQTRFALPLTREEVAELPLFAT